MHRHALNIGCGADLRAGYVNIDIRDDCGADLVCDARVLPYADGSVEEIVALDYLEHHPKTETGQILAEWHRVLTRHGKVRVKVPNLHALAHQIVYWGDKPGPRLDALIDNVYGGHKWEDFDTHHTGWTPTSFEQTLDAAGFRVVDNSLELNMMVEAVRR